MGPGVNQIPQAGVTDGRSPVYMLGVTLIFFALASSISAGISIMSCVPLVIGQCRFFGEIYGAIGSAGRECHEKGALAVDLL
jgi:hypothetical protein